MLDRSRRRYDEPFNGTLRVVIPTTDIGGPSLADGPLPRGHCLMRAHRVAETTLVALDKLRPIRSHWKRYQRDSEGGSRFEAEEY